MKISIIGSGYVGLIQGVGFAKLNHNVFLVDVDKEKVEKINKKQPPIYEKGLKELLKKLVPKKLKATTNLEEAFFKTDISFICVGTPSKKSGASNLNYLISVFKSLGKLLRKKEYHIFVIKSTVLPGTSEKMIKLLEKISKKKFPKDFGFAMCPEFLREGSALYDFFNPDRIIIGSSDKKSLKIVKNLFKKIKTPILLTNFREAEMIKYAANSFLATKISFINEIGNICKKLGIDTNIVAKGIGLDKRISPYFLKAGIGFGGSCFPKDVSAITHMAFELGYDARLLKSVLDVNKEQYKKLLELIEDKNIKNKKIAILGLTFKAGTDDIRESPAISVIKDLLMEQPKLYIYDPMAMEKVKKIFPQLNYCTSAQEAVDKSDIVLILTDWPEFKNLDYGKKLVIDDKNVINEKKKKNYEGIYW